MKQIINIILASLLLVVTSCKQPTYDALGDLPLIDDLDVEVTCDQSTNIVTFTCNSTGMLPVWYLDDGTVSSQTVITKLYANAGTYQVIVKAMSPNGLSQESRTIDFTLDSGYVDAEMLEALCGVDGNKSWVWDRESDGHFGCGESGSDTAINWWSAGANSQSESGMYDDVMSFGASGSYSYTPGDGGTIFVNEGVTISPFVEYSAGDGAAYQATTSDAEGDWSFSYDGDNTYIQLSSRMLAGYMPYDDLYESPKFRVISLSADRLVMIADNGDIAWRYQFIPKAD